MINHRAERHNEQTTARVEYFGALSTFERHDRNLSTVRKESGPPARVHPSQL
jgi:hypothetical protein